MFVEVLDYRKLPTSPHLTYLCPVTITRSPGDLTRRDDDQVLSEGEARRGVGRGVRRGRASAASQGGRAPHEVFLRRGRDDRHGIPHQATPPSGKGRRFRKLILLYSAMLYRSSACIHGTCFLLSAWFHDFSSPPLTVAAVTS